MKRGEKCLRKLGFRNEAILVMPFRQLCTIVSDAIEQASSENIKKSFKQTLFSLSLDGSEDTTKGSRRLETLKHGLLSYCKIIWGVYILDKSILTKTFKWCFC